MATNYRRGSDLERWIVEDLEAAGWYAVRSAGSKGAADVVAVRDLSPDGTIATPLVALIQAKSGSSALPGPGEWNALVEKARLAGAVPVLVHRRAKGSRAVDWHELTGPKTRRSRRESWPWRPWRSAPGRDPFRDTGGESPAET